MDSIKLDNQNTMFVNDNFTIDGTILCKFIHSRFSDKLKEKTGKNKLKFNLVDSDINNKIFNFLKNKEVYFLKKAIETSQINYPLKVKTFLNDSSDIIISEIKEVENKLFIKKNFLERTETSTNITDKITSISLKVNTDINLKNIKDPKTNIKLSIADLMELSKSDQLELKIQIKTNAVFNNNILYISATLVKISLNHSKMSNIYIELKEQEINKKNNLCLLPRDKLFISKYPKKSSKIIENIVNILSNDDNNDSIKKNDIVPIK